MCDRGLTRAPAHEDSDPIEATLNQEGPQEGRSTLDQHGPYPEAPQLNKRLCEIASVRADHSRAGQPRGGVGNHKSGRGLVWRATLTAQKGHPGRLTTRRPSEAVGADVEPGTIHVPGLPADSNRVILLTQSVNTLPVPCGRNGQRLSAGTAMTSRLIDGEVEVDEGAHDSLPHLVFGYTKCRRKIVVLIRQLGSLLAQVAHARELGLQVLV